MTLRNATGSASFAGTTRTAKIYISPETPIRSYFTVIAVPDDKWSERPLAVVVLREGAAATDGELRDFLAPSFARFWLPDRFEYVDEIPKTAVGKFRKTALREQFASATPVENA